MRQVNGMYLLVGCTRQQVGRTRQLLVHVTSCLPRARTEAFMVARDDIKVTLCISPDLIREAELAGNYRDLLEELDLVQCGSWFLCLVLEPEVSRPGNQKRRFGC